jgi:acyl carrier protein
MNSHRLSDLSAQMRMEAIEDWLIAQLAERLQLDPKDINSDEPFSSYGLSSAQALFLIGKLEKWLGRRVSPTLLFNYPTIRALCTRLGEDPPAKED